MKIVLTFEAPSASDASRILSDTSRKLSSVERMMVGRMISTIVNAPAKMQRTFKISTKNTIPKRPKTMDGIPESVSIKRRIHLISLLPFLEYSLRKMAAPIPIGSAISSVMPIVIAVETKADFSVALEFVAVPNIKFQVRLGMPFTVIKITMTPSTAMTAYAKEIQTYLKPS